MTRICFHSRLVLGAAAACLALGGAAGAQAQDSGWYLGLNMPLMFIDDTDSTTRGSFSHGQGMVAYEATVTTEHDTGFKFGGMIGRHLGSGLRVEGEVFMARAEVSKLLTSTVESRKQLIFLGSHFRLGTTLDISSSPGRASPALRRVGTG